jgi:hypothetical protein
MGNSLRIQRFSSKSFAQAFLSPKLVLTNLPMGQDLLHWQIAIRADHKLAVAQQP